MAIENLAKEYANSIPNSELVKYYEAAIPQYHLELTLLMEREKDLSVLQEFILKFTEAGINNINEMCLFLGINPSAVHNAIANLDQLVSVDINFSKVKLTDKGREALHNLKLITPQEVSDVLYMDSFTGEIYKIKNKRYTKKEIKNYDIITMPNNIKSPKLEDICFDDVKLAITKYQRLYSEKSDGELLEILELEKQYTEYNKVSVLVFLSNTGDIELRVFEKNTRKPEYETKLMEMYNEHIINLELDEKEDIDDIHEYHYCSILSNEVKNEAIRYTDHIYEINNEITQLKAQLTAYNLLNDEERDINTQNKITEIKDKIDEKEKERESATRVLSTQDHRPLLIKALKEATNTVIIISPWIKKGGLNYEILNLIKSAVNKGIRIIIGYGISKENDSDKYILSELNKISSYKSKGKLELFALNNTHEKILIMDNTFLVITSFNWLSFGSNPNKGFRREKGYYTEDIVSIRDVKKDLAQEMKITID